jgi:murein DD-endopeptidase MepM/ murein hydrolase activator NlpD
MARLGSATIIIGALLVSVPDASFATLLPGGETDQAGSERLRLAMLRERLDRRSSFERQLQAQIRGVAEVVERLRQERERQIAALSDARDEVLRLERELDRIVPRLVAQRALSDGRRRTSANALATLAGISRQAEIDPGVKARLLAVSPLMFDRLRREPDGLAALEAKGARLAERHRLLLNALPGLLAGRAQAEMDRHQAARRHRVLAWRHAELLREVARLSEVEAALARRILAAERVRSVQAGASLAADRAEPARQSALPKMRFSGEAGAELESVAARGMQGVANAQSRLVGRPLEAGAFSPPPVKPRGSLLEIDRARIAAVTEQADVDMARMTWPAAVESAVRLRRPTRPITPSPAALLDPVLQTVESRPVITMPARLGQPVAAPDDGRAAFAGEFGSYGLLLILEHEREYHTILWGFSSLHVATGDLVEAGQIIGEMGKDGKDLELHVEFRRNGRPVGALPWLAASSSKVRG